MAVAAVRAEIEKSAPPAWEWPRARGEVTDFPS